MPESLPPDPGPSKERAVPSNDNCQSRPSPASDKSNPAAVQTQQSGHQTEHPPGNMFAGNAIPYDRFLDCVHCGLCTSACPTYVETGDENDSPRGRIYLMRSVVDGRLELTEKVRDHLDLCLDCRSCETACPSGVQYGRLLEPFRVEMQRMSSATSATGQNRDWFHRFFLYGLFPYPRRMRWALLPARIMQRLKLDRLADRLKLPRLLPARLRRMYEQLPELRTAPPLPEFLPAIGTRRARVALFTGCVADAMFRSVHWATVRVLQQNGCDVVIPRDQSCCGAIHYHSGAAEPALQLIRKNSATFNDKNLDAVIVNVAGCGSMLKDYPHIMAELAAKHDDSDSTSSANNIPFRDVSEFLCELGPVTPTGPIAARVAYHDACHLQHAQKITAQPRRLLNMIPDLQLLPVSESELCCGAAGSYNLTQPEMADRLGERKIDNLLRTTPDIIASGNAGCTLQLQAMLRKKDRRIPVLHPIELLDLSYRKLTIAEYGRN